MRRGCNREKLAGKKRRAGVHLDDSPAEAGKDQQELVEEGQVIFWNDCSANV